MTTQNERVKIKFKDINSSVIELRLYAAKKDKTETGETWGFLRVS